MKPAALAPMPPAKAEQPKKPSRRCRELVDEILRLASEPWVSLKLGTDGELATVRAGGIVLLIGPTGRGKTSLAANLLIEHARFAGPALSCSLELPADEWTARAISSRREASWAEVLRGELGREDMIAALPERLEILDRDAVSFGAIERSIDALRAEYPDEPILLAVDYVQLVGADTEDEIRPRIGRIMRSLDRLARDKRVVIVALSQGSRASSRALANGERLGAETTDAGAESADLERWASVTVAIGSMGGEAEDGTSAVELSIGKSRMGGGDRVVPARFCGRTGLWRIAGEARPAEEVRAERKAQRDEQHATANVHAVAGLLAQSDRPLHIGEIRQQLGLRKSDVSAAVRTLLDDKRATHVRARKKGGHWPLWTTERAGLDAITEDSDV